MDKKPNWLKITPRSGTDFTKIKTILKKKGLVTVCEEANCPNMAECWHNEGTVTFMVMGDTCTRGCKFCAIKTSNTGQPLDPLEPKKIAESVKEIGLNYAVITSVDRDDLKDGGSMHFANCITEIKKQHPKTIVEVLIPDYTNNNLKNITNANPEVIAHNIETVQELQNIRDPRANFEKSIQVLKQVKEINPNIFTKSAIMLGLGETKEQVINAMKKLREVDCNILTMGQYLKPKNKFLEVKEYVTPKQFEEYKIIGEKMGFIFIISGPLVRSSYRAGEFFIKNIIEKKRWNDAAKGNQKVRGGIPSNS